MNRTWWASLALCASMLATCSPARQPTTGVVAPAGGPREAWQDDWDRLVVAAKQEGKLSLAGPRGDEIRQAMTEPFERKYGISVEYLGVGGPELPPKVQQERGAGIYNWDVFVVGTTSMIHGLRPVGALEPIESALLLPEVTDPTRWRGGALPFFESNRLGLALFRRAGQYFYMNTTQAKNEDFRSWRDLLDPKWKGKILVGRDPRVAGYGRAMFLFFYIHPELGPNFIRELVKQDLQILRDDRTSAQWLVQGRYALCFCSNTEMDELIDHGLPASVVDPRLFKEGSHATSAYANVALANRAPHPNAAKLYINWLLSQEGNTLFTKSSGDPSLRVDVATDGIKPWVIPEPTWLVTNTEEYLALEEPLLALLVELLGPP